MLTDQPENIHILWFKFVLSIYGETNGTDSDVVKDFYSTYLNKHKL